MAILEEISELLQQGRADEVQVKVGEALSQGLKVQDIMSRGLLAGMGVVGAKFKANEVYVPDVLMAARAMNTGMDVLKPHMIGSGIKPIAKAVIGTVQGDLHDIGKNLVKIMFESVGLAVVDLGKDVSIDKYIAALREHKPEILAMSALLTTTMINMGKVIQAVKNEGLREGLTIMVGGAPVTEDFARSIGADLYAADAASAAEMARDKVSSK